MTDKDKSTASMNFKHSVLTSLPMAAKYGNMDSVKQMKYERLVIKPKNAGDEEAIIRELREVMSVEEDKGLNVYNWNESKDTLEEIELILNIIFNAIIGITMFLCFFSLSSSMSANLYEQSKEIAMLRSIGMTRRRIIMLYIYEAFILVVASSSLGVCIGTIVGFTMTLQQMLFTEIPLFFYFPLQ